MLKRPSTLAAFGIVVGLSAGAPVHAADESSMMSACNSYAAHHLHLPASDIATVTYEGQRTDGTHAVNGQTTSGQSFQCSFNSSGTRVVAWTHSAPRGCPADVSEANRYMYPDCG